MNLLTTSLTTAAALLVVVCLGLPACQWFFIPTDPWAQAFAAATMLALGICKLVFFPLGLAHLERRNHLAGISLLVSALVFLGMSISTTQTLLSEQLFNRSQASHQQGLGFNRLTDELTSLNHTINTVNGLIETDLNNGFRGRALQQLPTLEKLQQQRSQLTAQFNTLQPEAAPKDFLHLPANASPLLIAIALHMACVLAVLCCGQWQLAPPVKPLAKKAPTKTKASPEKLSPEQVSLAQQIQAGTFGNTPSMKNVIKNGPLKGGFNKIKPNFEYLLAKNVIKKHGQGFALVQTTI